MVSLQRYARERVKSASIKDVAKGAKTVADDVWKALKKAKTITPEDKGVIESFKKSILGRTLSLTGKAAKGAGKAAKWSVTHKGKFSPMKGMVMGGAMAGTYKGIKKGLPKMQKSRHHGPAKPESVYQDPRRRLR